MEPHPRPVGHPLSINGEGEDARVAGVYGFGEGDGHLPTADVRYLARGEDARVAGVYGFGEVDGHLPAADVRYLARGTFGMVGSAR